MRVAVLTLTRDRVGYTRHCFTMLQQNAGVPFDHYILDQASEDDTLEFLEEYLEEHSGGVVAMDENVGIHRGWNHLIEFASVIGGDDRDPYDVFVTFDNDCELVEHGALAACCQAVHPDFGWVASPTVQGLQHPLTPGPAELANGLRIGQTPIVGGICRAIPGWFIHDGFRFNENMPIWGGDEAWIAAEFPGRVGWLLDWSVNHYRTTDGQQAEMPEYFRRKFAEMGR